MAKSKKKPLARKKLSKPAAPPIARTARPGKAKASKPPAKVNKKPPTKVVEKPVKATKPKHASAKKSKAAPTKVKEPRPSAPVKTNSLKNSVKPKEVTSSEVKESLKRVGLTPEGLMSEASKFVYKFAPINGKEFNPSQQQIGLFDWVRLGEGNAFVEAVAGSGKTTSLLRAIEFMKGTVVCIAFGAKIAAEFKLKVEQMGLGHKVQVMTAHACGNRALRNSPIYKRTELCKNFEKSDAMLAYLKPEGYQEFPPHLARATIKLVSLARQSGVMVSWDIDDLNEWEQLADHYSVDDLIPEHLDPITAMKEAIKYAIKGVHWSLAVADKMIEFDDMCWVPLVKDLKFERFDWVLVDEAQDLNGMRRLIAAKLMKENSRLIAVGDRHQAIFGFTGADADSVDQIVENFECAKLPLTVTYRCGANIVKEAQKYVKHIIAADGLPEGSVESMGKASFEEKVMMNLTPDDVILCRINRPLVSLAFRLIRAGIACHVEGRSIGDGLISLARKWKSAKTCEQLDGWLTKYLASETDRLTAKKREAQLEAVRDRVETLRIIMEGCEMVTDVVTKIEGLFKDTNGDHKATVILSSVHKFKGREKPNVYIRGFNDWMPGPWAKKEWEQGQENNLIYVAITRAISKLVYLEKLDEDKQ